MIDELKARIAELERQLAESRDFAISEAAKIRTEYEQPDADRSFAPEYEVWQDDIMVASASGHRPDAIREILHYAAQYQQDGPVQIFEVRRQLCSADELAFALNILTEAETTASASVAGLMGG